MCSLIKHILSPITLATLVLVVVLGGGRSIGEQPKEPRQRIARLIEQLGDADYNVRQRAEEELAKLEFEAFDALRAAETHKDLEIASRAKHLLLRMQANLVRPDDPDEVKRCLAKYRFLRKKERLDRLRVLAGLDHLAGIPALCRLVRFERSEVMSKHAALAIIRTSDKEPPSAELAALLRENLGGSSRPAATWLSTFARFRDDPKAALAEWKKRVAEEQDVARRASDRTDSQIIIALLSHQIHWVCKLGNDQQEVAAAMRMLLGVTGGNASAPPGLADWLVEQRAWEVLNYRPDQFAEHFTRQPKNLLYRLAETYAAKGKEPLVDQAVGKALQLEQSTRISEPMAHMRAAATLQQRGLFKWAEREYRRVIEKTAPNNNYWRSAYSLLADMLHGRDENLRAAKTIEEMLAALDKENLLPAAGGPNAGADEAKELRAQMYSLFACHWAAQGDRAKQQQFLDKALEAVPGNVEALIAAYHLPGATPEYRKNIVGLIQQVATKIRDQLKRNPNRSPLCNELAWLVSNTEGDLDEALRLAQRATRLRPGYAGYHDTLARCYFAKSDYKRAVECQTRAAKAEPHNKLLARQLELFEKKLKEQ
jgi:tetratricopeptide (TPR) repeat protein